GSPMKQDRALPPPNDRARLVMSECPEPLQFAIDDFIQVFRAPSSRGLTAKSVRATIEPRRMIPAEVAELAQREWSKRDDRHEDKDKLGLFAIKDYMTDRAELRLQFERMKYSEF